MTSRSPSSPRSTSTVPARIRCTAYLKGEKPGLLGTEAIKWNFTKFLVDRDGKVVRRYAPTDKPEDLDSAVAAALL